MVSFQSTFALTLLTSPASTAGARHGDTGAGLKPLVTTQVTYAYIFVQR